MALYLLAQPAVAGPLEDGNAAYYKGDYAIALKLWRPLANKGLAVAQYKLGFLYNSGHGVRQDYVKAAKWYRLPANQSNASAQYNLGVLYSSGQGVPRDYAEAAKWYRSAADQGDAPAQYNLGGLYAKGEGVPQDYMQAHMWWNLAAGDASTSDTKIRDHAVGNRDKVSKLTTPDQIAEAQRLAREWLAAHPKN